MTTKYSTLGSTIRSHFDLNAQRKLVMNKYKKLLSGSESTLDAIKQASDVENKGLSNCCDDLEEVENRLALVEKNLPAETIATGKISSNLDTMVTMVCPQCQTGTYCISRPIKIRDLSDGHGFNATIVASIRMFKLKWGSHSSAFLISCMKCGHQYIHDR